VALPLQYHRDLPPAEAAQEVAALLELLELTPLAEVTPANVSGNWRQRAALARALMLSRKCCCWTIRWPVSARGTGNGGCGSSTSCGADTPGAAAGR
jgi:ABC-type histidine transport system ATPase subunit